MSRSVWTAADREIVRRMAAEGCSSGVICEALAGRHPLQRIKNLMWKESLVGPNRPITVLKRSGGPRKGKRNRPATVWTPSVNAELARLANAGHTDSMLAAHFGKTEPAIGKQLHKLRQQGVAIAERRGGMHRHWTIDRCRALLAAAVGTSNTQLADAMGLALSTVATQLTRARRMLAEAGEAVPDRGYINVGGRGVARHAARNAEIKRLWLLGLSGQVVADRVGTTRNVVVGVVTRAGLDRRTTVESARKGPSPSGAAPAPTPQPTFQPAAREALPMLRPILRQVRKPIPPVHLVAPTNADALPCRIRLGGELLHESGTAPTKDPKWSWRGTVRQARTLITRNALQGAVIEQLSTGANGGKHGNT